jgi:Na+/H+ antiporter NhaD/arsenite permease-like protein
MMKKILSGIFMVLLPLIVFASSGAAGQEGFAIAGIRLEFILFALTLVGVALFHNQTLYVALTGLAAILLLRFISTDFNLLEHLQHESSILLNLLGLLLGFSILAKHFEESGVPDNLPKVLPVGWVGSFVLLVLIFIMSSFLDNIAAALIGGSIALVIYKGKVHIGFIAAIVAASNAGGSGSVVGDTTTTMMWIDGIAVGDVFHAYAAAIPALIIFGIIAARQQHAYQPIIKELGGQSKEIDFKKLLVVVLILVGAIATNILLDFPAAGVWAAILIGALLTHTPWKEVKLALPGSVFLLSLVLCASMMPVDELPPASWQTAFILGFVSAVFDNIPLTKLALDQGGYDWGVLAYAVGFGGSMIWFGSSAGVAISNLFPQAKSVANWVKNGWHVILGYIIGFAILIGLLGWHPHAPHKVDNGDAATEQTH